jgi:hypothetical protein
VLMLAAAAAPVFGAVTGLAAVGAPNELWWAVPALVVMAAEAAWWLLPTDRQRTAIGRLVDVPAVAVAVGGVAAPLLVKVAAWIGGADAFAVPAFATAIAVAFAVMRWRPAALFVADLGAAAVASCLVAGAMALDSPAVLIAALAIALVGAGAFLSRTIRPIAVYVPAWWAIVAIVDAGGSGTTAVTCLTLLAALTALVLWLRARIAGGRGPLGWVEMSIVAPIAGVVAVDLTPWAEAATFLVTTSLVVLLVVAFDRRFHVWACAVGGAAGVLATSQAVESVGLEPTLWIGWAVLTAVLVAVGTLTRSTMAYHVAAAAAVVTLAVAAGGVPLPAEQVLGFGMVAAVVLSGLAFTIGRRSPLDTAAATAGALVGLFSGIDVDPMWVSGAWFVIGLQVAAYGFAARQPLMQLAGSVVAVGAAVSAWFTSGANAWLIEFVEPADITAGDLWMLAAALTALAAGVAARRTLPVNSWLAYSGGLTIAGMWLTSVQVERDTVWAVPTALTIGMVAAGIGAWRRLAALLIGGVVLIATTLLVAIGRDLTDLPTWAWLAIGGLGLLGAAVLIERASTESLKELAARWQ